ncbi:MAG TPA: hypothetical protein VD794_13380 [Flavisolibacter sp.]|nr:hypothetical protein [Flavisolibacter sp.]
MEVWKYRVWWWMGKEIQYTKRINSFLQIFSIMYIPHETSKVEGLILKTSHMADLSYLLTCAAQGNLDKEMLSNWIDDRILSNPRNNSDRQELELIHLGIRTLYDEIVDIIAKKKRDAWRQKGKVVDIQQAKYRIDVVADILKVEPIIVTNWTKKKGGFIRSFEQEGIGEFILEVDFQKKYEELTGEYLSLSDRFREKYALKINSEKEELGNENYS